MDGVWVIGEGLIDGAVAGRDRGSAVNIQRRAVGIREVGERHAVADERGALAEETSH